jgi:hypothetical protein
MKGTMVVYIHSPASFLCWTATSLVNIPRPQMPNNLTKTLDIITHNVTEKRKVSTGRTVSGSIMLKLHYSMYKMKI